MGSTTSRTARRTFTMGVTLAVVLATGVTGAGAHPDPEHGPHHPEDRRFSTFARPRAADPPEGTVSLEQPAVQWEGQYYPAGSSIFPGVTCQVPSDFVCDLFVLTVDVDPTHWETHSGGVDITIMWLDPANDFDLHVFDEDGNNVGSSIEVNPSTGIAEEHVFVPQASGVYDVVVNPFSVIDSAYEGEAVLASQEGPGQPGVPTERLSDVPCVDGMAGPFECDGVDLLSFMPRQEFNAPHGAVSDLWGWTDPDTGDEYVIMGKRDGTAFFRVTDPFDPVYLGELPNPGLLQGVWHDMKVYADHAFIVSESDHHGMGVFDLTRLRGVEEPQVFDRDAEYPLPSSAHNIAINEETGFAYVVGGNMGIVAPDQCLSGLHMINIQNPKNPTFAGCYLMDGGPGTLGRFIGGPVEENSPAAYVHDTQCVIYEGPDQDYTGRELCFNASEDQVTIADVTNKRLPTTVATLEEEDFEDVGFAYAHQGWLSEDHRFLFVNDELDEEEGLVANTRTIVLDVRDLDDPKVHFEHFHKTISPDHNNYVHEGRLYQSNYSSGLRILKTKHVDHPKKPRLQQVAFFDTFPGAEDTFDGTWSNYPFFESGTIAVSGRNEGLFLLRLPDDGEEESTVEVTCANCPVEVRGKRGVAQLFVSNTGETDDTYALSASELPEGWNATIRPDEVFVGAGQQGEARAFIEVPRHAAEGTYSFVVTATSTTDPSVSDSETIEVVVDRGRPARN